MDTDPIEKIANKIVDSYSDGYVIDAFELLLKLLGNILKNPTEEKFRTFKKTNETLKKKVLLIKENLQLLKEIGYIEIDSEVLAFNGNNFTKIELAKKVLDAHVQNLQSKMVSKEELEILQREELAKKNKEEIIRNMKHEREQQKKIKEQIEADVKEMSKREKPTDSKATQLEYGMHEKKFEPPQKKGG